MTRGQLDGSQEHWKKDTAEETNESIKRWTVMNTPSRLY